MGMTGSGEIGRLKKQVPQKIKKLIFPSVAAKGLFNYN